jgi:outer membrane lipoprotein SlyB
MQQANKVDTGIVVGYREVRISDDGTVGAVTGGAAGGILGAELSSPTVPTALAALGGTVVGGVIGSTIQHTSGDTTGWEYIVREPKGDLVSVTQREPKPLPIGQKVLVIEGKQARIVPDYATTAVDTPPAPPAVEKHDGAKPAQNGASASPPAATPDTSTSGAPTPPAAVPVSPPSDAPPPPTSAGSGDTPPTAPPS